MKAGDGVTFPRRACGEVDIPTKAEICGKL